MKNPAISQETNRTCYHATEHINQLASEYNILIYTSVVGTGVSIDLKGHFGSVFSWNQGNQSENSTRQFLGRLREGVPPHGVTSSSNPLLDEFHSSQSPLIKRQLIAVKLD